MKKVILRFLRNKMIEVGRAATIIIISLAVIYIIGDISLRIDCVYNSTHQSLLNMPIFNRFLNGFLFGVMFIPISICAAIIIWDWIKDNWERAKEETGYKPL